MVLSFLLLSQFFHQILVLPHAQKKKKNQDTEMKLKMSLKS